MTPEALMMKAAQAIRSARLLLVGIPMIVTADSGDRDRAVPGPWI